MKTVIVSVLMMFLVGCTTVYSPTRYEVAYNELKTKYPTCQVLETNTHVTFLMENGGIHYFVRFDHFGKITRIIKHNSLDK